MSKSFSSTDLDQLRSRAESSLFLFAKGILGYDWLNARIHKPLCEILESSASRIRVVLPRGWLKTTVCTIAYPLWAALKNPNIRILIVQNTFSNACKKLTSIRSQIESNELLRALWPGILPTKDCIWKTEALQLNRDHHHPEATFEAAGTGTRITGRHYNLSIEDDTVAPDLDEMGEEELLPTQGDVEKAIGYHRLLTPLIATMPDNRMVIVGTRWFPQDLLSWSQNKEPRYTQYYRAVREDKDGNPDENGDLTYPERFSSEVLDSIRDAIGPYLFNTLYLNTPVRSEDMIFRPEWFSYYDSQPKNLVTYTTVDLAPPDSKSRDPDYNVILTCGKDLSTGYIYVLDYFRDRCTPSEVISQIFRHVTRYHPVTVGLETVAYQKSMSYWIRERMSKEGDYFMITEFKPTTKKEHRVAGLQPVVNSGSLKFQRWMTDLVNEMLSFPLGTHDDLIDSLAMQLSLWASTPTTEEKKLIEADDPLSWQGAAKEIHNRQKASRNNPLVWDVFDRDPSIVGYL